MTITAIEIGGNEYTSYASVAEADRYLAVDPVRAAPWAALTADTKGSRLIAATRRLDLLDFSGKRAEADQPLAWPRVNSTRNGASRDPGSGVPLEVQNATILLAGSIATDPTQAEAGGSGSNIRRERVGPIETEYFRPTIPGLPLQDRTAFDVIAPWLSGATGLGSGLASGTNGTSAFEIRNAPGLDDGYA